MSTCCPACTAVRQPAVIGARASCATSLPLTPAWAAPCMGRHGGPVITARRLPHAGRGTRTTRRRRAWVVAGGGCLAALCRLAACRACSAAPAGARGAAAASGARGAAASGGAAGRTACCAAGRRAGAARLACT